MRQISKQTGNQPITPKGFLPFSASYAATLFGGGGAGLLNGLWRLGGGCGVTSLSDVPSKTNSN